jgi:hypothetical protein
MFFMLIHYFSKLFNYKCSSCWFVGLQSIISLTN